jgi:hypothetical protein
MTSSIDPGNRRKLTAVFTSAEDDSPIDPDEVHLIICDPEGTETEYVYGVDSEIVKEDVGNYYAEIDFDTPGKWAYRWTSLGAGKASQENLITVEYTKTSNG